MESLRDFVIKKVIGKGTYGTVYLCKTKKNGDLTIIKDIPVKSTVKDQYQDAENEIKIISSLSHPNIIKYNDSYYYKNHVLVSMEYATNGNLAEYMYQRRLENVPPKQILFFFSQILLGVKYIHSMNIIHRDLKAENILLSGAHGVTVKIGDFGIAKMLMSGQKTSTVIGTPYYLAPELCDGEPYDAKTDVWALGCLLYEMCTHQRAFESETLTGLVKAITSANVHPIDQQIYGRGMQTLVDSMLTVVPEKRPSVREVMGHTVILPTLYAVFLDAEDEARLHKIFSSV